ncbi:iron-chelator utilization protein [Alloactinosynnema sp. L-07]|uniref:siderophore-interacting protein n=1 Tax=Alloactinosynnema sp. L-07 TaxID=1653480 RepID=UPI00065F09FB|nr:siderophore-interacting protein [Alloactinosynnema sp. L-07]CRK56711.1 iron-chelator utilization protein [Alloactinosynnema sp. L-07]
MDKLPVWFLDVADAKRVSPHMARITLTGDDLADFVYAEPDQQVKLYFPRPGQAVPRLPEPNADGNLMAWYQAYNEIPDDERPWMRSYTIRARDAERNTIDIDFVLHEDAGPATRWAASAKPGDTIGVFGPSTMFARPVALSHSIGAADWVLLAGDDTALPAMSTIIEWLPEDAVAVAYIEVNGTEDEQRFDTRGTLTTHWLHRADAKPGHSDALVEAVRDAVFPEGSVFAWLGGESGAVRALRRHLVNDRGIDKRAIDFAGYWRLKLTQDDAPTEEDMAEAMERVADAQTSSA